MSKKILPITISVESSETANKDARSLVEMLLREGNNEMAGIVSASMPKRRRVEIIFGDKNPIALPRFLWPR